MNRLRFLASRLVQTLLVLIIIAFITFAIFSLWPSDPAGLACGKPCTPGQPPAGARVHGL